MQENLVGFFLEGGARAPNDPMHPPPPLATALVPVTS